MKSLFLLPLLLSLSGCATSQEYMQYLQAQENIAVARSNADAERYRAMAAIAQSGDTAVKVSAMFALQEQGAKGAQGPGIAPPKSVLDQVISLASPLLHFGGLIYQTRATMRASDNATALGIRQSDNATALGVSTNASFASMAGSQTALGQAGFKSLEGVAGQIQAPVTVVPQANVTTTTLSGTGVLGSGTYSTASNTSLSGTGVLGGGSYSYNPNTITNNADDHTYTVTTK